MRPIGRARMDHEARRRPHPMAEAARAAHRSGALDRREFLRIATLLGVGVGAAQAWAGPARAEPAEAAMPAPGTPRAGGVLRCAMPVQAMVDPAAFSWVEASNQLRHQNEHLTITGADNLTRPMLARAWAASDDLKTWTFTLREGVAWHSGDAFTAADVAFNMARWLDPRTNSSNLGLFDAMTETVLGEAGPTRRASEGAVEVVDPLTVRLHLSAPVLAMPENLYNYPTALLHPGFSGDVLKDRNGTGPYQLVESVAGERAVLKKVRRAGWRYWGASVDHIGPGWVDEIRYLHHPTGGGAAAKALAEGAVDLTYELDLDALGGAPETVGARLLVADTAQTAVIRMRTDLAPFRDVRVRRAIQLCCDPRAYPAALFRGRGRPGEHHHVAPIHPEYFPLPKPRRRIAAAKALLAEAGYPDGLSITLDVGNTSGVWQQRCAELLAEQAAPAGLRIAVNVIPTREYERTWRERAFGLTQWSHRPLGTMALSLAYRAGVPWNETRYANPAFDAALTAAEAHLDLVERRDAMEAVQRILQRDAVMVQPAWRPVAILASTRVKGLAAHPTLYHQFNNIWLDA